MADPYRRLYNTGRRSRRERGPLRRDALDPTSPRSGGGENSDHSAPGADPSVDAQSPAVPLDGQGGAASTILTNNTSAEAILAEVPIAVPYPHQPGDGVEGEASEAAGESERDRALVLTMQLRRRIMQQFANYQVSGS